MKIFYESRVGNFFPPPPVCCCHKRDLRNKKIFVDFFFASRLLQMRANDWRFFLFVCDVYKTNKKYRVKILWKVRDIYDISMFILQQQQQQFMMERQKYWSWIECFFVDFRMNERLKVETPGFFLYEGNTVKNIQ